MLRAWTAEQDCILAEVAGFFSSFSTSEPGKNEKEAELGISKKEILDFSSSSGLLLNTGRKTAETIENIGIKTNFEQPAYKINNVVSENLNTKENTLGIVMNEAIISNKNGSVNDIIAAANLGLAEKLNTEVWKEQSELKEFIMDNSVKLMAYTHVITQQMPDTISAVDNSKIDNYKLSLVQLCELVKKLKAKYQSTQLSVELKSFMGLLINQLSTVCCSGKKLEVLLTEVNTRKESILARLQLAKFVENHPGLEHCAGVQPGGTFVLVYLNKEKLDTQNTIATDSLLSRANVKTLNTETASAKTASDSVRFIASASNFANTEIFNSRLEKFTTLSNNINFEKNTGLNRIIPQPDIPNNTVVADFSLPYLCCSNCASINFIVQKKPASLRLEKDIYCLGKDEQAISFIVSPENGEIKSIPESDGIIIRSNSIQLLPNLFPDEWIGKPIKFTVNNQITDAELLVLNSIHFDFNAPLLPITNPKILFVPTGDLDGATFFWNFGDGQTSIERNPTHIYQLPVNDENKITVSLTVTAPNGICQNTVSHAIQFEVNKSIALSKTEFCGNDKTNYPFIITPEGADVKIEGPGVNPTNTGFVFIPANTEPGKISFTLNSEISDFNATVFPAPVAALKAKQIRNQLVISNQSENANSFVFVINDKIIERKDLTPVTIDLTPNSPTVWKIKLIANGAKVCKENVFETSVETKFTEIIPDTENCVEKTLASIISDQEKLAKIKPDNRNVSVLWKATGNLYGGSTAFNQGVINTGNQFLSGERNREINDLFLELIQSTAKGIVAVDRTINKTAFTNLVQIFELQLQLFYNILRCQKTQILIESESEISPMLNQILEILKRLKEQKVVFSDSIKLFYKQLIPVFEKTQYLAKHLDLISSQNLI